jgi:hypothetical protein
VFFIRSSKSRSDGAFNLKTFGYWVVLLFAELNLEFVQQKSIKLHQNKLVFFSMSVGISTKLLAFTITFS